MRENVRRRILINLYASTILILKGLNNNSQKKTMLTKHAIEEPRVGQFVIYITGYRQ